MIIADFSGARWRKSGYSSEAGACVEVAFAPATWRKSSHSSEATACVEVALNHGTVGVRDSKQADSPILIFPATRWATFIRTR